tara:strand:- start:46 stop:222 length:177 start_codon:yes stop_codon:yes gene_type:complete
MAHGKALGQYQIKPVKVETGFLWDVVDKTGNVVCWSHNNFFEAIMFAIMLNLKEKNDG